MMEYYAKVDGRPHSPTYMAKRSLHRLGDDQADGLILERWDTDTKQWVDNPELLAVTGIGGSHSYVKIGQDDLQNALDEFGVVETKEAGLIARLVDGFVELVRPFIPSHEGAKQAKYQVQPYHSGFGKADQSAKWSFSANDGNAILDKGGWELFKKIHLVTDTSDGDTPENKGAYTYPVAKIVDGKPTYFFKAASTVNAGIHGGARGADLPAETNEKAKGTLRKIYKAFDRDPEAVKRGSFVTIEGQPVFVGGAGQGGGGAGGGSAVENLNVDLAKVTSGTAHHHDTQRVLKRHGASVVGTGQLGEDVYEASGETFTTRIEFDRLGRRRTIAEPVERTLVNMFESFYDDDDDDDYWAAQYAAAGLKYMKDATDQEENRGIAYAFKARDGSTWWLQFTSNAFRDREGEIFTTKALNEYVERNRDKDVKGEFWYRHIPGTKFGTVRWQAMVGRFLVQAGPFDNTPIGEAFKSFFEQYPQGHPDIAPLGWGTSHGYNYKLADRLQDGIYNWLDIKESTVLPSHLASNPWSPIPVILKRSQKMNDQEKRDLEKIGGQKLVDMVLGQGEGATKKLEPNVDFKANNDSVSKVEALLEGIEDAAMKAALMGALDEFKKPKEEKKEITEGDEKATDQLTREEVAEALKEMASILRTEILEASKSTAQVVESSVVEAIAPLVESVKEITKDEDEKIAEKAAATPAASLQEMVKSALTSDETKIAKDSNLAQAGPKQAAQQQQQMVQGSQPFPPFIQRMIAQDS